MTELEQNIDGESNDGAEANSWDEPLLADDLEQAYLRAMEATEAVEREFNAMPQPEESASEPSDSTAVAETPSPPNVAIQAASSAVSVTPAVAAETPRVSEKQVVEAALFVGGMPLTAKKLSALFHTEHGFGFVECLIDELNQQYVEEHRPYTITLGEGGYRLTLLPEFESVRNKVFGYGPKDVKLTQDALEVLSLVAYRQPISKSQIEELGKSNSGPLLRQLLQRELIRIDREHSANAVQRKSDPPYATTPRFLSLFGLGNLRDLPVAADFNFK